MYKQQIILISMALINGSFSDIFKIFGLFIGLLIGFRCLYVFVFPLFCYNPRKISMTEMDENTENVIMPLTTDVINIPIVKINGHDENEEIKEDDIMYDIPIASAV